MQTNDMQNREMVRRVRPGGVTLMSVLLGIQGLIELVGGVLLILAANSISRRVFSNGHTIISKVVDTLGVGFGAIGIVVGIITLIFVYGLWTLKRWAYWLVIVIEGLSLVRSIFELIRHTGSTLGVILGMIIPAIIFFYFLISPDVRQAFRI